MEDEEAQLSRILHLRNAVMVWAFPATVPVGTALVLLGYASQRPPLAFVTIVAFPVAIFGVSAALMLLDLKADRMSPGGWRREALFEPMRAARWTYASAGFLSFTMLGLFGGFTPESTARLVVVATFMAMVMWLGFHFVARDLEKMKDARRKVYRISISEAVRHLQSREGLTVLKEVKRPILRATVLFRARVSAGAFELRGRSRTVAVVHAAEDWKKVAKFLDEALAAPKLGQDPGASPS